MEHKWIVGIDIAKDKFDVCIKVKQESGAIVIKGSSHMSNHLAGFDSLWQWVCKRTKGDISSIGFLMEATGVYYENLAHYLCEKSVSVYVVLANKAKNYFKALHVKTKTDKVDASILAQMGFELTLKPWVPMSGIYMELRDTTRAILALKADKAAVSSRLHAMKSSKNKSQAVLEIYTSQLESLQKSMDQLKEHRHALVEKDTEFKEKVERLTTIKGVRFDTAIGILSETNGFALFNNMRQLVSYAGLDVTHNQSGDRNGKTRISKKGNAHIREILFMPAISAVQYNKPIRELHQRIKRRNPKLPIKGVIAGMRKLLLLMYTLWKNQQTFDQNYQWNNKIYGNEETRSSFG